MTYAEVEAWLGRARGIDREIQAMQEEKEQMFAIATKITAPIDGERVQTSAINSTEVKMLKYIEYTTELDNKISELLEIKKEIQAVIERVRIRKYRLFLHYRYIRGYTMEHISALLQYSVNHVYRIKIDAIKEIGKLL